MPDYRTLVRIGVILPTVDLSWAGALDASEFAAAAISRGLLTPFQARRFISGQTKDLVVGQYVLVDAIGKGGMGQVFLAYHRGQPDVRCVLKTVTRGNDKRQAREARLLTAIRHPHVVGAFDFFGVKEAGGIRYWLAMEWLPGPDLSAWSMVNGPAGSDPTATRQVVDWIRQAALGLSAGHALGIVHRDVKPANLILDANGCVKVADFGIARQIDEGQSLQVTATGQVLGTANFLAPEQAIHASMVDERADIYGLGCTLFYLLESQAPYRADNPIGVLVQHAEAPLPKLQSVSNRRDRRWLQSLIDRMLAKEPEQRPTNCQQIADELQSFLSRRHRSGKRISHGKEATSEAMGSTGSSSAVGKTQLSPRSIPRGMIPRGMIPGAVFTVVLGALASGIWYGRDGTKRLLIGRPQSTLASSEPSTESSVGMIDTVAPTVSVANLLATGEWEWRLVEGFGDGINTSASEDSADMTADGLTIVFMAANSPEYRGVGEFDLWMAKRDSIDSPWSSPTNLGETVNTPGREGDPDLSLDGTVLLFRGELFNPPKRIILKSVRDKPTSPWSQSVPHTLQQVGYPRVPTVSLNGMALVGATYKNETKSSDLVLFRRQSTNALWTEAEPLGASINGTANETGGTISDDGRVLIFARGESLKEKLWMTTRLDWNTKWSEPVLMEELNSAGGQIRPKFVLDGRSVLFGSNRPGGVGSYDIYLARLVNKQGPNRSQH